MVSLSSGGNISPQSSDSCACVRAWAAAAEDEDAVECDRDSDGELGSEL